jgi:gluconolactonase
MPEHLSSLLDSTEPTLRTTGWGRTEGPLWHAAGSVTCVDGAGSRLLRWDTSGHVRVVREHTSEGNGCTLDRQGRLIMCEGVDHRRITHMDAEGTVMTIAERWQGKRFNKPNDVVCGSDGSRLFTAPELRLAPARREIGFSGVYRLDPQGAVHLATDACAYPNGLAFSPDASILYVAISRLDQRYFAEEQQARCARTAASAPWTWLRMAVSAPIVCSVICPRPIPACPMASTSIPPVGYWASAPAASG